MSEKVCPSSELKLKSNRLVFGVVYKAIMLSCAAEVTNGLESGIDCHTWDIS